MAKSDCDPVHSTTGTAIAVVAKNTDNVIVNKKILNLIEHLQDYFDFQTLPKDIIPVTCFTNWAIPRISPKIPTARVPHIPHTRCTEIAPTGSSILILSMVITEKTTITPAIAPITRADHMYI